jgi:hypothetical protein
MMATFPLNRIGYLLYENIEAACRAIASYFVGTPLGMTGVHRAPSMATSFEFA